jgi:hypothetical protein
MACAVLCIYGCSYPVHWSDQTSYFVFVFAMNLAFFPFNIPDNRTIDHIGIFDRTKFDSLTVSLS